MLSSMKNTNGVSALTETPFRIATGYTA